MLVGPGDVTVPDGAGLRLPCMATGCPRQDCRSPFIEVGRDAQMSEVGDVDQVVVVEANVVVLET